MLLKEFIYFEENQEEMIEKHRYDNTRDLNILDADDTRKSRLTLKIINFLRKSGDAREKESKEELELVKKMYANPPTPQP